MCQKNVSKKCVKRCVGDKKKKEKSWNEEDVKNEKYVSKK